MNKNRILAALSPLLSIIMLIVGWLGKDLQVNGVSGLAEPMMVGGLGVSGVIMLVWKMWTAWKLGGGKLDGVLTVKEITDPADVMLEKIAPQLKGVVDKLAQPISDLVNAFLNHQDASTREAIAIPKVPTAATLIDLLSKWDNDPTKDAVDSPLYHQMLDMLTRVVIAKNPLPNQDNPAEQLRKLLHQTTAVPASETLRNA